MANLKKEIFKVRGMACTGCEATIEEALHALEGVHSVKADFSKSEVTVAYDPSRVSFTDITAAVKASGYGVEVNAPGAATVSYGTAPKEAAGREPGKEKPFTAPQFIGIAVMLLALYLIINSTVGFNFIPEVNSSMGYGVLFLVGLLTSLHCVAMCGGINLSQCVNAGTSADASASGTKTGANGKAKALTTPSLLYNLGRVTSYTIIGGVVGAVGAAVSFTGWARGIVAIVSGLFMIVMGLSMTGIFPWINKITPRLPRAFREKAGKAGKGRGPYIVGLLNGLMPCGPLQAMQLYALGTGSFIAGATSMFFFSLGTVPLMFGLGAIVTLLGSRFTKKMMKFSAVLVAVLGVVMLGRGLALSGVAMPLFSAPSVSESTGQAAGKAIVSDGAQYITSNLAPGSYPAVTVQKGIPVVWNIKADKENINGCNRTIIIPEYNIQVDLKPGDNLVKFTPNDSGTIPYSCWMGMIRSQIKVVDDLGAQTAQSASDESAFAAPAQPGGGSCCAGGQSAGGQSAGGSASGSLFGASGSQSSSVPKSPSGALGGCCG